jgi:hypothetical protein
MASLASAVTKKFPRIVALLALLLGPARLFAQLPLTPTVEMIEQAATSVQVKPAPRALILVMDGVGYDLAAEMHRKGELKNFLPPAPLIVAFPSDTNPALVEMLAPLGAAPAAGYEDYYFDPAANEMRGGILHRFSRKSFVEANYRDLFDYHPHPVRMTVEYAVPVLGPAINGAVSLARIKDEFRQSSDPVFVAYFDASDTAAHVGGRWLVREQLRYVDRWVSGLRAQHAVEVVILSDHGNDHRWLRRANLEPALRRAGFDVRGDLKDDRRVVLPQFGLISNAVLYTAAGREAAAAEAVLGAKGVDFAVYRDGSSLVVVNSKGRARIDRRVDDTDAQSFRYVAEVEDPLQLNCLVDEFSAAGFVDADGFVSEDKWLAATAGHVYPDPLRRLWRSFDGLVRQPASVIVSLKDGYYTGSIWLNLFAWMQATHGSLRRAQSLGVVLSTTPALFAPDATPFTGENILPRILKLSDFVQPSGPCRWDFRACRCGSRRRRRAGRGCRSSARYSESAVSAWPSSRRAARGSRP